MADQAETAARKVMAENKAARDKAVKEGSPQDGSTPTPTQEENDLAKLGVVVDPKADDGSGPEMTMQMVRRAVEAKPAQAGYATRSVSPAPKPKE
jgi:hypothetical protein